jgi:hypothetical protein
MQDVEQGNRVILGTDDRPGLPHLKEGERVVAFDDELDVEGVVEHEGLFWIAALDWDTLKRFAPAQ